MDWDRVYTPGPPPPGPPEPIVVEVCWRIRTPNNHVLTCGIFQDAAPGLDVRAFFNADELIRSERAAEIGAARDIAAVWKQAVLERGFVELVEQKGAM